MQPDGASSDVERALEEAAARHRAQATVDQAAQQKVFDKAAAASAPKAEGASLKSALGDMGVREIVGVTISTLAVIVPKISPKLTFTQAEQEQLTNLWAPVAEKYFPDLAVSVEFAALAGTALIVAPKFMPAGQLDALTGSGGAESVSAGTPSLQAVP